MLAPRLLRAGSGRGRRRRTLGGPRDFPGGNIPTRDQLQYLNNQEEAADPWQRQMGLFILIFRNVFHLFAIYLCMLCVCVRMPHVTTLRNLFFPTMWVSWMELRSSDLAADAEPSQWPNKSIFQRYIVGSKYLSPVNKDGGHSRNMHLRYAVKYSSCVSLN